MNDKSIKNSLQAGELGQITTYQAGAAQALTHRILQKHCDAVLKQFGITKMQWLIIGYILDAGPRGVRLTDVATTLGTTMSYLTGEVNLLEAKGMLARQDHGSDSRSKIITVHEDFVPKCAVIEETLRNALRKSIYAHIDPAEFRIYMKIMYQLADVEKLK